MTALGDRAPRQALAPPSSASPHQEGDPTVSPATLRLLRDLLVSQQLVLTRINPATGARENVPRRDVEEVLTARDELDAAIAAAEEQATPTP